MQPRTIRYTGAVSLAALLLSSPATAQRWNDLEDALEGRELVMRPTTEGRRKLYLDAQDGDAFVLHRGDRLFPLREREPVLIPLREREPVLIVDADPEDDHIELELQSARLGRGRVDFHGRAPAADEFERWLDEVFEITTPEDDFHRYVGNRQSGTLHIRGVNHLPGAADREPFHRVADALDRGYDRCGVCFVPTPTVSDYDTERSLALFGLQHVRATY